MLNKFLSSSIYPFNFEIYVNFGQGQIHIDLSIFEVVQNSQTEQN